MTKHDDISSLNLFKKIKNKEIVLAGNKKLKIYGMLHCASGKRMKKENRVFFSGEEEALENGYRPCGNCMKTKYNDWERPGSN
jgi:methylphosphotriester-DNA--protein-cysteine methyltransferase